MLIMFNSRKVTIVVPVYNVEEYIIECFNSIAKQSYKDIECIFVDDCGTDNSIKILENLLKSYSGNIDFKLIKHLKNRGLSAARNTGLSVATGDYIWFVDSDDYIVDDSLYTIFSNLNNNFDIIVFDSLTLQLNNITSLKKSPTCSNIDDIAKSACDSKIPFWAQFKIYRTKFLKDENLKFEEGLYYEDVDFLLQILQKNPSVKTFNVLGYVYRKRLDSITLSKSSPRKIESYFNLFNKCINLSTKIPERKTLFLSIFIYIFGACCTGILTLQPHDKKKYIQIISENKIKYANIIYHSGKTVKQKCISILLRISPYLLLSILSTYIKIRSILDK